MILLTRSLVSAMHYYLVTRHMAVFSSVKQVNAFSS
ncbi:hypothetical protein HMPREF1487_08535 [Pseudomonas sp. HPB0071]|uniref:Uncharacterized protein n=1 Tax=Pseudomonas luteola TaxID=47886 RepID=A0A2X2F3Y6_PSELU|nr:hypothetical protein HMPREF1487_08535 [Pseudomonas sp. HPB0071]SHJ74355.1 hypothetical protein SAMN05216295_1275 [Pseudomonas zeshuii]SPZ13400.1 Uncharacterised protein [Pseudomonas luteola]